MRLFIGLIASMGILLMPLLPLIHILFSHNPCVKVLKGDQNGGGDREEVCEKAREKAREKANTLDKLDGNGNLEINARIRILFTFWIHILLRIL